MNAFTQYGCIYECSINNLGLLYCTSEKNFNCGYCLGTKDGRTTCM